MKKYWFQVVVSLCLFVVPANLFAQSLPGGVDADIQLWLKSDEGITESGSDISLWADQSGNGNDASQPSSGSRPKFISNEINFNPGILFDGAGDYFETEMIINAGLLPQATILAVYKAENTEAGAVWGESNGSGDRFFYNDAGAQGVIGTGPGALIVPDLFPTSQVMLVGIGFDEDIVGGSAIYTNGSQLTTFLSNHDPGTSFFLDIGGIGAGEFTFDGLIFEVLIYQEILTEQELQQVDSYLALKYGLLLGHDYLASNGTLIRSLGDGYAEHIAGIGRDDASDLNQKQSKSSNEDALLTIGLGSIAANNEANTSTFTSDLQFLTWGHNGASTEPSTAFAGTDVTLRMSRTWKVEESGAPGEVEIQVPGSFGITHLLVGSDSDLTGAAEYKFSDNGDGMLSVTVDFVDGDFFSLGVMRPGPAGVDTGIALWLRADAGIVGSVSGWLDKSGLENDAFQNNISSQPAWLSSDQNYNPGILFDGIDDYLDTPLDINASASPHTTVYSVYKAAAPAAGAPWGEFDGAEGRYLYGDAGTQGLIGTGSGQEVVTDLFQANQARLIGVQFDEDEIGGSAFFEEGTLSGNFTANHDPAGSNSLDIGSRGDGASAFFNGMIYETIVFQDLLSEEERRLVESYLAFKYGITLHQDYLASDGSTIRALDGEFDFGIAGIGRDDNGPLDQKQAISGDSSAFVTMALGGFAEDNASNENAFGSDLSFMTWGHNKASTEITTVIDGSDVNLRMARSWKIAERGSIGTIVIKIPDTVPATHLLKSSTSDFLGTSEHALTDFGDGFKGLSINFDNGEFFTFGAFNTAPGGVDGLVMWLKADEDVVEEAGAVAAWTDQSLGGFSALQVDLEQRPLLLDNAGNFNPGILFDGTNDCLDTGLSINAFDRPDITITTVFKATTTTAGVVWGEYKEDEGRYLTGISGTHGTVSTGGLSRLYIDMFALDQTRFVEVALAEDVTEGSTVVIDGAKLGDFTSDHAPAPTNLLQVGCWGDDTWPFNGYLMEMMVHDRLLTAEERALISSYLRIKYSVSRGDDLLASDGTVIWDIEANAPYYFARAIIGRDDAARLNQKQSMDEVLSVGLGNLAITNAANEHAFSEDGTFVVFAHDHGVLQETEVAFGVNPAKLLERKWMVHETGEAGPLELQFDLNEATISGTTINDFWLVVDNDEDPANGSRLLLPANAFENGLVSFAEVDVQPSDILMLVTHNPNSVTLPVEFTGLEAVLENGVVQLSWSTAGESNNAGFEVQRRIEHRENQRADWQVIGFVDGQGSTDQFTPYAYSDDVREIGATSLSYRLKQIDFDGTFWISAPAFIEIPLPQDYTLTGFPNPFNPVATIEYELPVEGRVKITVFDAQGRHIKTLVDEVKVAGSYQTSFDATSLASGTYLYRMEAGGHVFTRTLLLVK